MRKEADTMSAEWEQAADEFGRHERFGGWASALLVARWVENAGKGRTPNAKHRISAAPFAKRAKVDRQTVLNYLSAWERYADKDVVPHAADIGPRTEVKLPTDVEFRVSAGSPARTEGQQVGDVVRAARTGALRTALAEPMVLNVLSEAVRRDKRVRRAVGTAVHDVEREELRELVEQHRHGRPEPIDWTKRMLNLADHVLALHDAIEKGADPDLPDFPDIFERDLLFLAKWVSKKKGKGLRVVGGGK